MPDNDTGRVMPRSNFLDVTPRVPHIPSVRTLRRNIDIYTPTPLRTIAHTTLTRISSLIDIFPPSRSPSPSDIGYMPPPKYPAGEDSISRAHDRDEEDLALKERGGKMEVVTVPVLVDNGEEEPVSRMSTPSLTGSEFQGPLLTDSMCMRLALEGYEEERKENELQKKEQEKEKKAIQAKSKFLGRVFGTGPKVPDVDYQEKYKLRKVTAKDWEEIRRENDLAETTVFHAPMDEEQKAQRARIVRQWKTKAESREEAKLQKIRRLGPKRLTDINEEEPRTTDLMLARPELSDSVSRVDSWLEGRIARMRSSLDGNYTDSEDEDLGATTHRAIARAVPVDSFARARATPFLREAKAGPQKEAKVEPQQEASATRMYSSQEQSDSDGKSEADARDEATASMLQSSQGQSYSDSEEEKIRVANELLARAVPFDPAPRLINPARARPIFRNEEIKATNKLLTRAMPFHPASYFHPASPFFNKERARPILSEEGKVGAANKLLGRAVPFDPASCLVDKARAGPILREEEIRAANKLLPRAVPFDSASRLIEKARARPTLREERGSSSKKPSPHLFSSSELGFSNDLGPKVSPYDSVAWKNRDGGYAHFKSGAKIDSPAVANPVNDAPAKAPIKAAFAGRRKFKRFSTPAEVDELQRHSRGQADVQQDKRQASKMD